MFSVVILLLMLSDNSIASFASPRSNQIFNIFDFITAVIVFSKSFVLGCAMFVGFFSIRFDVIPSHLIMPHLRHLYFLAHLVALIRRRCHMIYVRGTLTRTRKSTSGPNINSLELLCAYFYGFFILFFWLIYFSSFSRKINLNATAAAIIDSIAMDMRAALLFKCSVCLYLLDVLCVQQNCWVVSIGPVTRFAISPIRRFLLFSYFIVIVLCQSMSCRSVDNSKESWKKKVSDLLIAR